MNITADISGNLSRALKLRFFKLCLLRLSVFALIFLLGESVHAQGCSVILKIKDPVAACPPSTIDLTSASITEGSTEGLKFSYYSDKELTNSVPNPKSVITGTYYIKGVLTGSRTAWVAGIVNVTVLGMPQLVITSSISKNPNKSVDLTLLSVKSGSESGLIFSYWSDPEATKPLLSPESVGKGNYYIKRTSIKGCSDIMAITVSE